MKKLISLALAAVLALGILSGCGKKADAAIQIAVPNDTTNEARALLLLEANGIIKLKGATSPPGEPSRPSRWQSCGARLSPAR